MGVIQNFNKIINLTFSGNNGIKKITCPTHGRKPNIEITGSYTSTTELPAFNIVIKNLYITNLNAKDYSTVTVEAGYGDNLRSFKGSIFSMYQQNPGPESSVYIQCKASDLLQYWVGTRISLSIKQGDTLKSALTTISSKLNLAGTPYLSPSSASLVFTTKFERSGSVSEIFEALQNVFADKEIYIRVRNNKICVWSPANKEYLLPVVINFLSAPMQFTPGAEAGQYATTISAPWMPNLDIGDQVSIAMNQYISSYSTVGSSDGQSNIFTVDSIQFHFSTVGSINNMIVKGWNSK